MHLKNMCVSVGNKSSYFYNHILRMVKELSKPGTVFNSGGDTELMSMWD